MKKVLTRQGTNSSFEANDERSDDPEEVKPKKPEAKHNPKMVNKIVSTLKNILEPKTPEQMLESKKAKELKKSEKKEKKKTTSKKSSTL